MLVNQCHDKPDSWVRDSNKLDRVRARHCDAPGNDLKRTRYISTPREVKSRSLRLVNRARKIQVWVSLKLDRLRSEVSLCWRVRIA